MKTILFPTDFSENCQKALDEVISYLQKKDQPSRVLLLHTYLPPPTPFHDLLKVHDTLRQDSIKALEKEIQRIKAVMDLKISFEALSYLGTLENVIAHLVGEKKIDEIILGNDKGRLRNNLSRLKCPIFTPPFKEPHTGQNPPR